MREQIQKPESASRTIQSKTNAVNQASIAEVLQTYKKGIYQRQSTDEEEDLFQGKFETAQRESLDEEEEPLQGKAVIQFLTQDHVESVISEKMGIRDQIVNYGGMCGGWSKALLKEKNGLEIWKKFEMLYKDDKLTVENITKPMINYFKKVMRYQYILDISDYMNYDDADREGREVGISVLGTALDIIGLKTQPTIDREAARYDRNEYEIRDKKGLSDIKNELMEHNSILLSTDSHFMSIKKISDSKFILSETNETGYDTKSWTGVVKSLRNELKNNDYVVHIKFM